MANKYYITDEPVNIARGLVVGTTWLHRLGFIPTMPNNVETVIMSGGITSGRYVFPTSASVLTLVSTNTLDTGKSITVTGLDSDYNPLVETVVINGTTPVTTTNQFLRVQRLSSSTNGIIGNVTASDASHVLACLRDGDGQSLQCVYTVPKGVTGYLRQVSASVAKNGDAIFRLHTKSSTASFTTSRHIFGLAAMSYTYDFVYPTVLPEKTDVEMTCLSSTGGSAASATFDILLVNNTAFN